MTSYCSFKFSKIYLDILKVFKFTFKVIMILMHSVIINLFSYHISWKNNTLKQISRNFQFLNLFF